MKKVITATILVILLGALFCGSAYLGIIPRHRIIVIPNDLYGDVTIAENKEKGEEFNILPFNIGTTKIVIPESGKLIISDWDEYGGWSSQYFVRENGIILDGTHPWTSKPKKIKTRGSSSRTPKDHETFLISAELENGTVQYTTFTILSQNQEGVEPDGSGQ